MIIDCKHYRTGQGLRIRVKDDRAEVEELPESAVGSGEFICTPGLIDLQINGFAGVDFGYLGEASTEEVTSVVRRQWALGVAHILPTVTTGSFCRIQQALERIAAAAKQPQLRGAIVGVHLEGPYISPEDGPRGAHPREHVRPPDWDEFCRWQEAAGGLIRIVTLSPEWPQAVRFIERLRREGIAAAIGHTQATTQQIREAVAAGACLSTHLGNGSHAMLPRHPNYIWDQLAEDRLYAGLIVDGYHLPPAVVKCMVRVKGPHRVILVSDAVSVAGLPPGPYQTLGADVELTESGRVQLAGTPYLAGSALKMPDAVVNAAAFADISLVQAVDMASTIPAAFLNTYAGACLDVGMKSTFTVFRSSSKRLYPLLTVVGGRVVYAAGTTAVN